MSNIRDIRIVEGILDALDWTMETSDIVEAFASQIGNQEVLEGIPEEELFEYVASFYKPEDVFERDELDQWADDTYGADYMREVREG